MSYEVGKSKYELKYLVPDELKTRLRELISPFVHCDHHMELQQLAGESESCLGYTVRSIYFDTPYYTFYREKDSGISFRKKLRIRGYNLHNDKNVVFLEIKHKHERKIFKNRCSVRYRDLRELLSTCDAEKYVLNFNNSNRPIEECEMFLSNLRGGNLVPVVLVVYEREAYFGKFDKTFRITFDKNIRGVINPGLDELYDENNVRYCAPGHFVLEVKFYSVYPSWMNHIVSMLELPLQSFSKYTRCIDAHMQVPDNQARPCRAYHTSERF